MSNETLSPSQTKSDPPINGEIKGETPPTPPTYPKREYKLEDFSQQAINRGQQEINYLVTVAGKTIVEALNQVNEMFAKLAVGGQIDLEAVGALATAIKKVSQATKDIAGPFPPGCASGSQSQTKPGTEG